MSYNYNVLSYASLSGIIIAKPISFIPNNKVYDGTNIVYGSLSGSISGDIIIYNAIFNNINVGYQSITISSLLNNYNLSTIAFATIYQLGLQIIFNSTKIYDNTNNVTSLNIIGISGILIQDQNIPINISNYIANYLSLNVGNSIRINYQITISGNNNYYIPPGITFGNITPAPVYIISSPSSLSSSSMASSSSKSCSSYNAIISSK